MNFEFLSSRGGISCRDGAKICPTGRQAPRRKWAANGSPDKGDGCQKDVAPSRAENIFISIFVKFGAFIVENLKCLDFYRRKVEKSGFLMRKIRKFWVVLEESAFPKSKISRSSGRLTAVRITYFVGGNKDKLGKFPAFPGGSCPLPLLAPPLVS